MANLRAETRGMHKLLTKIDRLTQVIGQTDVVLKCYNLSNGWNAALQQSLECQTNL